MEICPDGNGNMGMLLKRKWKCEWKNMLIWQGVLVAAPVLLYILYCGSRKTFINMGHALFELPAAVYAFAGFGHSEECGNFRLYLYMLLMILQTAMAWKGCRRMVRSVYGNEDNGSIYTLCNQWYSRRKLIVLNYLWIVGSAVTGFVLSYLAVMLMAWKGTIGETARMQAVHFLAGQMGYGIIVLCLMLSLAFVYTVYNRRAKYHTGSGISLGLLVIGNLYKVRDVIFWLLEKKDIPLQEARGLLSWMDGLYWISPLSWLNPYADRGSGKCSVQIVVCSVIIIVSVTLGILGYEHREPEK